MLGTCVSMCVCTGALSNHLYNAPLTVLQCVSRTNASALPQQWVKWHQLPLIFVSLTPSNTSSLVWRCSECLSVSVFRFKGVHAVFVCEQQRTGGHQSPWGEGDKRHQVRSHTWSKKASALLSAGLTFHNVRRKKTPHLDWADKLNCPVVFQPQQRTQTACLNPVDSASGSVPSFKL